MIELRAVRPSDLATVNEIFCEAFGVDPVRPVEYAENLCYSNPEGCFVATEGGGVVGYASSHRSGRIGYIGNLAVGESHRGRGIGKALTIAARDQLCAECDVVGLAVEPDNGRNLGLYSACGFEATWPSCFVYLRVPAEGSATACETVRTAAELGSEVAAAIRQVRGWSGSVLPGLDFTRDLERFAERYPDRLWFDWADGTTRGFLAQAELFRGDAWGAVQPGPGDATRFDALVGGLERAFRGEPLVLHLQTNFTRVQKLLLARGYQVVGHKTCMLFEERANPWPRASDALFLRPWWS